MSKDSKPTWNFPPLSGGVDVVQNSASEFFTDNPISKLVRETIQNSLDAKLEGLTKPVKVTFTESVINRDLFDGMTLGKHLRACHERVTRDKLDAQIGQFYKKAERSLRKNVRTLSVVDTGTTGLNSERKWKALVRQEGAVDKQNAAAGGSFGIGKNAVFNVSALRAVLYSTRYLAGRKGRQERMQAKSTLMSHPSPNNRQNLQHVGFLEWPKVSNLSELPNEFRLDEPGTGVFILGFDPQTVRNREWIDEMLRAVVENFFYAIHNEALVVEIKSRGAGTETVTRDTIASYFERLYGDKEPNSYYYHRAICERGKTIQGESDLGDLELYLLLNEGPRRTAYVNRMGMLISDSRESKVNPVSPQRRALWPDFAAVVTPNTDEGDSWSRIMETPSHDGVSPERLKDPKARRNASKTFADARRSIRAAIDEAIGTGKSYEESNVRELREILPDEFDPDMPGNTELVSTEVRRPSNHIPDVDIVDIHEDEEDEEVIDEEGGEGGWIPGPDPGPHPGPDPGPHPGPDPGPHPGPDPGPHPGPDPGPHPGPDPDPKPNPPAPDYVSQPRARLRNPRFMAIGERECLIAFELDEPADLVTLTLRPAGVELGERMGPVRVASASLDGRVLDCDEDGGISIPNPPANRRLKVRLETSESIANRAIVARGSLKAQQP